MLDRAQADSEKIKDSLEDLIFKITGDLKDHNGLNPRRLRPLYCNLIS